MSQLRDGGATPLCLFFIVAYKIFSYSLWDLVSWPGIELTTHQCSLYPVSHSCHIPQLCQGTSGGTQHPNFLQGSFIGLLLGSLLREFCSLLLRKIWHLSQILWPPVPLEPSSQTSGKHFWEHPHTPVQRNTKPMPNQAPSETNSFLDENQARINSPCSVPNHNLLERLLEASLSHGYPSYMAPFIRQSTSLPHPQSLKSVHILVFQLQSCCKLQWLS